MNADLVKKALEVIPNANILINLVSRRVRQVNAGGGGASRPLVADSTNLSIADIALREIIEEKISYELPEHFPLTRRSGRNRSRPKNWTSA